MLETILPKNKESHHKDVIQEYDMYFTKFSDMLQRCQVKEEDPNTVDSQLASQDSSPAGTTGCAKYKVGKFMNMPQMDPGALDFLLTNKEAKKYVDRFDNYTQVCYPGGHSFENYRNLCIRSETGAVEGIQYRAGAEGGH